MRIGVLEFVIKLKDSFSSQLDKIKSKNKSVTGSLTKLWQNFGISADRVFMVIYNSAKQFFSFINDEYVTQERALARLTAQLDNYGNLSKENIKLIQQQATELQNLTGISDDQVISSAALAQSYGLTFSQIQALLPAMVDMAAFTEKTTGTMGAMEDQVKLMGYVLEGQVGRLKLMGITMDDAQKKSIALGDKSQRLATFLKVVDQNAGGVAESMHNAAGGGVEDLKNAFSDLGQKIGDSVVPAFDKLSRSMAKSLQSGMKDYKRGMIILSTGFVKLKTLMSGLVSGDEWEVIVERMGYAHDAMLDLLDDTVKVSESTSNQNDKLKETIPTYDSITSAIKSNTEVLKDLIVKEQNGIQLSQDEIETKNELIQKNAEYNKILEATNEALSQNSEKLKLNINNVDEYVVALQEMGVSQQEIGDIIRENQLQQNQEIKDSAKLLLEEHRKNKDQTNINIAKEQELNKELGDNKVTAIKKVNTETEKLTSSLNKQKEVLLTINEQLEKAVINIDKYNAKELKNKEATITIYRKTVKV